MDFSSSTTRHAHMDFRSPSSSIATIDRKPATFSFDDNSALDSAILDTPILMSPTNSTQGIFSPDASIWEDFSTAHFVDRAASSAVVNTNGNNPFFTEQSNNPFARLPPNQAATYGQQSWPVTDNTASRTPTAPKALNPFGPGDFGVVPCIEQQQIAFHGLPMQTNVRPSAVFPQPAPEPPMSPHTHADWMAFNQQEMESRPGPKRARPNTPPRSFSPRRDGGIRKKNARFDIPVERNLFNIDNLIQSCTNDDDLKELKQQKRLLRNRQAALDSRQRKKKHTEELEEEKKVWIEKMCGMQDEFANMRVEYEALVAEKENWHRESLEMHHMVNQLNFDKEELVRNHTLETGELRKKVSVLTERLEAATSAGMTVAPSTTLIDFASEMDNLNMGNSDWDSYLFNTDFSSDGQATPQAKPDQPLALISRGKDEDKPVASGLLLMLLLCGAFVASKSGNAAPPIPRMPDEVRAASATVLDTIFKDAGVSTTLSEQNIMASTMSGFEPAPSGIAWPKPSQSGSELAAMSASHLDQLHSRLTGATKEQEHEQLFSVTPAQYTSMTSLDFTRQRYSLGSDDLNDPMSPGTQPSHRRNLAESLAAMREQNKGESAAEIYTRSLLWDKIAPEVVHEFKRMVEASAAMSRPGTSDGVKLEIAA